MPQSLGVVHVFVSRETAKDGLLNIPANACRPFLPVRPAARHSLAIVDSPSVSPSSRQARHRMLRIAKLDHKAAVEIKLLIPIFRFTRWVRHDGGSKVRRITKNDS
jgi:hypothetical protein